MEAYHIKEKFTELYDKEADSLFRYCFMRVHEREQALDIVQDVFLQFWKASNAGEKIKYERAYLFTLARNRIIDWYRKKKSSSLDALLEHEEGEKSFDHPDERAHTETVFSAEAKRVFQAIEKLEPIYRDVLYLRFTEDLSPQEIATILDTTANIVSVRITRGLEKLKEQFHT